MNPQIGGHNWATFITVFDFVLLPFYLMLSYLIILKVCNRMYPHRHPWRRYFLTGFWLKISGAVFIGLVYEYYYAGGDTSAFFYHATVINQSIGESIIKWINLVFKIPEAHDIEYSRYINQMAWYRDKSAYTVSSITAVVSLFGVNTYLPTTILFALLSYSGNWAMFKTFAEQYPRLAKPIAISILFIPSTFVWGSGIFKDTICLAALGWMTFAAFRLLVKKEYKLVHLLTLALCFYLLLIIKIYIVLVFIPALAIWILNTYSSRLSNGLLRVGLKVVAYASIAAAFFYITTLFAAELGRYSLENIAYTSNSTRSWIYYVSTRSGDEGSFYSLGEFEPTLTGMLSKFPLAVNVTLFRPYIWEARKPMVFLNSIEATFFLFLTLKVLFSVGLAGVWKSISRNPNVQFFLIFTIIFAFSVGISSYNFGALSRYRIPCLPFYALALTLIYYDHRCITRPLFKLSWK